MKELKSWIVGIMVIIPLGLGLSYCAEKIDPKEDNPKDSGRTDLNAAVALCRDLQSKALEVRKQEHEEYRKAMAERYSICKKAEDKLDKEEKNLLHCNQYKVPEESIVNLIIPPYTFDDCFKVVRVINCRLLGVCTDEK